MKILFVARYMYPPIGGGMVIQQIFAALAKRGHKIYVVTSRSENAPEYEEIDGLQVYRPYSCGTSFVKAVLFAIKLVPYLKNFLKSHPVDIICNGAYSCTLPASYVARREHVPLITYLASFFGKTWFQLVNPFLAFLYWMVPGIILRFGGDNIVCPSNEVGNRIRRHTKAEVTVIPSFLDADEINYIRRMDVAKKVKEGLGMGSNNNNEQLLLFVGRLSPEKNVGELIKAMPGLGTDFKLVVVGDGPERAKLENLTSKLDLQQRVIFLGRESHKEALAIMKSCDVLILPSKTEVLPTVVLEALALGRPVIATRVGGIAEIESANLYLINSVKEIKEILPQIKPKPDVDILEHYSREKFCSQFEALFEKLVMKEK
jgi:glycosyltransferase involved in cell wall biosynthesis